MFRAVNARLSKTFLLLLRMSLSPPPRAAPASDTLSAGAAADASGGSSGSAAADKEADITNSPAGGVICAAIAVSAGPAVAAAIGAVVADDAAVIVGETEGPAGAPPIRSSRCSLSHREPSWGPLAAAPNMIPPRPQVNASVKRVAWAAAGAALGDTAAAVVAVAGDKPSLQQKTKPAWSCCCSCCCRGRPSCCC